LSKLTQDPSRNSRIRYIVDHILRTYGGDILITSCRVAHLEGLAEELRLAGHSVAVLTGGKKNRSKIYDEIKQGVYRITVATQAIVAEGASNPRWWHVISTTPFSDPKTAQQLKGRPIRKDPEDARKTHGHFWDIVDNVQMCRNMGRTRYNAIRPHMEKALWYTVDSYGLKETR